MNYKELKAFSKRMESEPMSIGENEIIDAQQASDRLVVVPGIVLMVSMVGCLFLLWVTIQNLARSPDVWFPISLAGAYMCIAIHIWSCIRTTFVVSVDKRLEILSSEPTGQCQEALNLCETFSEARRMRDALIAANRPLRRMHLKAMRRLDADGLAERQAREKSCKALHGIAS